MFVLTMRAAHVEFSRLADFLQPEWPLFPIAVAQIIEVQRI
jgi:hypothetical protein